MSVISQPRTITVDQPQTVGTFNFDSLHGYTIAGPGTITVDADGGATINVVSGEHTIAAPLAIVAGVTLTKLGAGAEPCRRRNAGGGGRHDESGERRRREPGSRRGRGG